MPKLFKNIIRELIALVLVLFALLSFSKPASAATYGSNPYGTCDYQTCSQSTQVPVPPNLLVDINLHDNQIIPEAGYNIIVTPLNGQGASFKQVDFYIDGFLVHSQAPGQDGTVQWFWNPGQYPGTDIKTIITSQDGQTVTKEFHVTIAKNNSAIPGSTVTTPAPPSVIQQIVALPGNIIRSTQHFIQQLPPAVKHSLPYFLFLVLLGDVLLLLLQFSRELEEARTLQVILIRQRQSGQLKKMLVDLMSHYLRTPVTIISGAIDITSDERLPQTLVASLKADIDELNRKINNLISRAQAVNSYKATPSRDVQQAYKPRSAWRQPFLLLPVIIVGIVAFLFDYLASHNSDFSANQVNLVVQFVLFGSLVTTLYLVFRRLEISKHDVAETKHVIQEEIEFNHNRDELIDNAATELSGGLGSLDNHIASLGSSEATTNIRNGQRQLHAVVKRCVIASQLKGITSTNAALASRLSDVVKLTSRQQAKVQSKRLSIDLRQNIAFMVRSPELLTFVIETILDNAIEYSPIGGHIELTASQDDKLLKISAIDHGPGIPEDKRYALFQAFSKVEGTEVFDHQGTGFSLYLDKLIMSYLLGDITIEPAVPQGIKVTLSLPAEPFSSH